MHLNKIIFYFTISAIILLLPVSAWTVDNPNWQYNITNATITFPTNQTYSSIETGADYIDLEGNSFQTIPSSDSVNITILTWTSTYRLWTEDSSNHSVTTMHAVGGFPPKTDVTFTIDGQKSAVLKSNDTGYISFSYIGGYSRHTFGLIILPPPFIASTGQTISWWALFIISIAVMGVAINYKPTKVTIGGIIALTILVIVIGISVGML